MHRRLRQESKEVMGPWWEMRALLEEMVMFGHTPCGGRWRTKLKVFSCRHLLVNTTPHAALLSWYLWASPPPIMSRNVLRLSDTCPLSDNFSTYVKVSATLATKDSFCRRTFCRAASSSSSIWWQICWKCWRLQCARSFWTFFTVRISLLYLSKLCPNEALSSSSSREKEVAISLKKCIHYSSCWSLVVNICVFNKLVQPRI